jgi:hypothetical protein
MICPELSQTPSPEPDSSQLDDVPLEFMIEPLAFPGLAGVHDGTAIMPDGEDVELDNQSLPEVLASQCMVLSPRKLPRNTLLVAIVLDWASTVTFSISIISHIRSHQSLAVNGDLR